MAQIARVTLRVEQIKTILTMDEKDEKKVVKQELDKQELEEKDLEQAAGGDLCTFHRDYVVSCMLVNDGVCQHVVSAPYHNPFDY